MNHSDGKITSLFNKLKYYIMDFAKGQKLNVMILVDESESITEPNFELLRVCLLNFVDVYQYDINNKENSPTLVGVTKFQS